MSTCSFGFITYYGDDENAYDDSLDDVTVPNAPVLLVEILDDARDELVPRLGMSQPTIAAKAPGVALHKDKELLE